MFEKNLNFFFRILSKFKSPRSHPEINAIALVGAINEGRAPSFENTVYSTFVPESLSEVQSIQLW